MKDLKNGSCRLPLCSFVTTPRETWRCFACAWRAPVTATRAAWGTALVSARCPTHAACAASGERAAAFTSARRCGVANSPFRVRCVWWLVSVDSSTCLHSKVHAMHERVERGKPIYTHRTGNLENHEKPQSCKTVDKHLSKAKDSSSKSLSYPMYFPIPYSRPV